MAFDPSTLKPGDEVGITWRSLSGQVESVSHVAAIDDDGMIVVEGQGFPFWPDDGREVELVINGVVSPSPAGTRLCEPTDEGRAFSLQADIEQDLDELRERLEGIPLDELRKLDATIKVMLDRYPAHKAIDLQGGDGASLTTS